MKNNDDKKAGGEPTSSHSKRNRSPNYPALGLREAVERITQLYNAEGRAEIPQDVAAKDLGYNSLSGPARTMIAALKKFGLLDEVKSGIVRVSEFSLSIILPKSESEKVAALRKAFFRPKVYSELWERFGADLPSDNGLKAILIREFQFNDRAVDSFIRDYKDSVGYSEIKEFTPPAEESTPFNFSFLTGPEFSLGQRKEKPKTPCEPISSSIPLRSGGCASITVPSSLTSAQTKRITDWLDNVVKPWLNLLVSDMEEESDG